MNPKIEQKYTSTRLDFINIGMLVAIIIIAWIRYDAILQAISSNDMTTQLAISDDRVGIVVELMMAIVLLCMVQFLQRRPHWLNYPMKVTAENAPKVYPQMQQFLRYLTLVVLAMILISLITPWLCTE